MKGAALLLAGISALAPIAALGEPVSVAPETAFALPDQPVILTRTVRRPLPDGKEVVSRRSYVVRFARDGTGYRVDGELVASEVEAPPALRAIAELEKARPDKGLFPIRLDARGRIVPEPATARVNSPTQAQGAALTSARIASSALSAEEKAQAAGFVQQVLDRGGGMTAWPEDLFHPQPGLHKTSREIALPGGTSGLVTISTEARVTANGGLLDRVDRVVVTELGGSQRTVSESWTLRHAGAPL